MKPVLSKREAKAKLKEIRESLTALTPVEQHASGQGYVLKNSPKRKFVKGLTKVLAKTFYSDYEYIANQYQPTNSSGLSNPHEGLRRGRIVHEQLQDYGNKTSTRKFQKMNPKLHEYSRNAIAWLLKYDLEPLFSEFPVADQTLSMGTAVDMVCSDQEDNLVLIEWKNGMNNYIHRGSDKMQGPFEQPVVNSPLNQAFLQLCFTKLFFLASTGIEAKHCFVVNMNEEGVTHYELPDSFWRQHKELYHHALEHLADKPDKKKKKKSERKLRKNFKRRVAAQKRRVSKHKRTSSLF